MPKRPLIRSIHIENYRIFHNFRFEGIRRVNIIGGLNGSGKTTLLEAIFTFQDRMNPLDVIRPFVFRQLPATFEAAKSAFFNNGDGFSIACQTRSGNISCAYKWEEQPTILQSVISIAPTEGSSETSSGISGLTLEVKLDEKPTLRRHFLDAPGGMQVKDEIPSMDVVPISALLSRFTSHYQADIAQRYSEALQKGKRRYILETIQRFLPDICDIELLQIGPQTILHAELPNGSLVPLSFMGDGALTVLAIVLAIIQCSGGVILLDEFDAAIHYSKLHMVWELIAELAAEYDCQIFSATHSFESIKAAVRGFKSKQNDLLYIRLDNTRDGVVATPYNYEELSDVEQENWEIR